MAKKPWTPPEETKPCPYHPDVQMTWVQKRLGKTKRSKLWWFERCEECEWNPPDLGSGDDGRTSPNVKHQLEREVGD